MKKQLLFIAFLLFYCCAFGSHIVGGDMSYKYNGPGNSPNTKSYTITLKLFRDNNCTNCAPMPADVFIGVFNNDNNSEYPAPGQFHDVFLSSQSIVPVKAFPVCIVNPPDINYSVGEYTFTVELPENQNGYTASYQTCCRVSPLENVQNNVNAGNNTGTGSTYSCIISGTKQLNGLTNSSAVFNTGLSVICQNKPFTFDFSATDPDNDSLVYSFYNAFDGGLAQNSTNINPQPPAYNSVNYINGFSADQPLGLNATIDPHTGIISGIAPIQGKYVVSVIVAEFRNGIIVGTSKKDFIVNVASCDFSGAKLDPKPVTCDGFTVSFSNADNSPLNQTFLWNFGDSKSGTNDTSSSPTPTHLYTDTGVYMYKLVVNKGQACADSAIQIVKVYPGFNPAFSVSSHCKDVPFQFKDISTTSYGVIDTWKWNFGDPTNTADTSHSQNPVYTYNSAGTYNVSFTVTNSKGCIKTIVVPLDVSTKPVITKTNDTLICSIDSLQLNASTLNGGNFIWSPNYNITNPNSANPVVYPKNTTRYFVSLTDAFGCTSEDSVLVSVKQFVSVKAGTDTGICRNDSIQLNPVSDALHYKWSPAGPLSSDTAKYPIASPSVTTRFYVIGNIGKCQSSDSVLVKVSPYPAALASSDTALCYGDTVHLHASGGTIYSWKPATFLNNPSIPDPIASPQNDIQYIAQVNDTLGCPKPSFDTVFIKVYPKVIPDAGPADTSVVVNQPLQLNGSGGTSYLWTPSTGLNDPAIQNPVATLSSDITYSLRVGNEIGCYQSDTIHVHVYSVIPGLYIPNAFTPNGNGRNDYFRPIAIGIKKLNYFRIYNRWGQIVFATTTIKDGWDGTLKGKPQDAGVYVWIAEAVDFNNVVTTIKGTVTLIR